MLTCDIIIYYEPVALVEIYIVVDVVELQSL